MGGPFLPACIPPLSPYLHGVSALPVICIPEPYFALANMHCMTQHCTRLILNPLLPSYRYRTFAAQARQKLADQPLGFARLTSPTCFLPTLSRHSLTWILSLGLSAGSTELATGKGTVLPSSVFLVLGTASPARAVAHNSYSCPSGMVVLCC
jgi:hypothetical protein